MKDKLETKNQQAAILFLDDWKQPPRCVHEEEIDANAVREVKIWRLQILLAVNPYGIPSLAFAEAYQKMYNTKLDIQELGFEHLSEMVTKMSHVFAIQEPDETTAILFPQYRNDKILHDARLGHNFSRPNFDCVERENLVDKKWAANDAINDLIHRAWLNRDEDFPADAVLAGETYETLLPMTLSNLPGTRGVYHGVIVGAATPATFYIRLKGNDTEQIRRLPLDIKEHFERNKDLIDAYTVPKEFLYPGFPCLCYGGKDKLWERAIVVGRSSDAKKILIESVDFGGVYAANPRGLYLIPRKFFEIPRQSIHVALAGIKPIDGADEWPVRVGSRMRCFSLDNYWLEIVLLESPPVDEETTKSSPIAINLAANATSELESSMISGDSDLSNSLSSPKTISTATKSRLAMRPPSFKTIILDRNDEDLNIYLDEVLILETYAVPDEKSLARVQELKEGLEKILENVPRPKCPFVDLNNIRKELQTGDGETKTS